MDEYERVKEQIWFTVQEVRIGNLSEHEATEKILSFVEIKSDGQSLPKYQLSESEDSVFHSQIYKSAQQDMLQPDSEGKHFIRVLPKEK